MTKPRIAIVANPVGAEREADTLRELLDGRAIDVDWLETTEADPGTGQARRAAQQGADLVLACGGDGTVRACAQGLIGTKTSLGIIPAGTGNLLARNLGIPGDVPGALAAAVSGLDKRIDVGFVDGEAFLVMAGAGLDASIMEHTSAASKDALGSLAYVATATRELTRVEPTRVTIDIDDRPSYTGLATTVLVGNCGKLQMGIDLMPDARLDDGTLDVLILTANGMGEWLQTAATAVQGNSKPGLVERRSGRRVVARFASPLPYELDGDEREARRDLTIEIKPAALVVRVPKEEA